MPTSPTKCDQCGGAMRAVRENIRWDALPSAVIIGLDVERCTQCGAQALAFPAMSGLVDLAARTIVAKQGRLAGAEIRFLRSYLELEGAELAEALGSNPSSISRWEHDRQPIGRHADLFLRALVLLQLGTPTPASYFQQIAKDVTEPRLYAFEWKAGKWTVAELASEAPAAKPKKRARR